MPAATALFAHAVVTSRVWPAWNTVVRRCRNGGGDQSKRLVNRTQGTV
ncbi:hypothetical protein OSH08_05535 [Kaistia geumhonensis]|uniref:Uncharacterized protein n=1 Tax=Kaistia geumhonensis TaxID=410839 RepID=A0ABU0M5T3_9HYPH|nr:hypothetical protein [Kaistia geumhonensis]MCX5478455.1 hypothetical protein [Kaistia geumhonensis]MDQ0516327.1 hypothetical protein [Kaistia geumhonensis]